MSNLKNIPFLSENRNPWLSFLLVFVIFFAGLFIGQFVAMILIFPLFEDLSGLMAYIQALSEGSIAMAEIPNAKLATFIFQGMSAIGGFLIAPFLYMKFVEKKKLSFLNKQKIESLIPVVITIVVVIAFMAVNAFFIEWNMNFKFPSSMSGFEEWAQGSEEKLADLTQFLTTYDNIGEFLIAILIIAVLPALGEELVFRGLMQNTLFRISNNIHVAIWVTGFIFGAIHLQFYGMVPRMLLGVLFGYIYYWSGSIWLAILAHFVNNGFMVLITYLHQQGIISYDIESTESVPLVTVAIFAGIVSFLLYYFKNHFSRKAQVT